MRALCTILAVLLLTIWSLATIFIEAVARPSYLLASRIEADTSRELTYLARAGRGPMAQTGLSVCSRPAIRSLVSIGLADLELAHRSGNAGTWAMALAEADVLLRNGIRCFPYDGNLWLRLAVVEFARKGPATDVAQLLTLSAMTAPSEAWIVGPRIAFAARLSELGSTEVRRVLESDIRTVVAQARYAEVSELYLKVGDPARQIFDDSIALLERGQRRSELSRTIASVLRTLPPERQP